MMSTPDRFGPITDVLDVARAVGREIDLWADEYLSALERQRPTLKEFGPARLHPSVVRHAGAWRPEEGTPACITWVDGDVDHQRGPDRSDPVRCTVQVGVALIVSSDQPEHLAALLHAHVAAVRKLLLDRPTAGGVCQRLDPTGSDFTGIDVEARGSTLAQAELSYDAIGVSLGAPGAGPPRDATPRDDPSGPWPPVERFETADLSTAPTRDPSRP
jgi:hypothetical protein